MIVNPDPTGLVLKNVEAIILQLDKKVNQGLLQKRAHQEHVEQLSSLQLDQYEEEKLPAILAAPPSSKIFCSKCEASFDDCELGDKFIYVDECFHPFCKQCLTKEIETSYPDVKCMYPDCKAKL